MDLEQFKIKFVEDANELVSELERALLVLEDNPSNIERIGAVFRVMHTLKGTAGMYGFDNVSELTHRLETLYDSIRSGKEQMSRELITITFQAVDCLKILLNNDDLIVKDCEKNFKRVIEQAETFFQRQNVQQSELLDEEEDNDEGADAGVKFFFIVINPDPQTLKRGLNPLVAFTELAEYGKKHIWKHSQIPFFNDIDPRLCYTGWEVLLTTSEDISTLEDVFVFFMEDEFLIHKIDTSNIDSDKTLRNALAILRQNPDSINQGLQEIKSYLQTSRSKEIFLKPLAEKVVNTLKQDKEQKTTGEIVNSIDTQRNTIRVDSEKLDELMNLVSELVTTRAKLSLISDKSEYERLHEVVETLTKLSKQFRDNVLQIRLVPVETLMYTLKRLVRDLAQELNKDVDFVAEGVDTELDKNIINNLESPLMHIIRNSLDHGIETREERLEKSKSTRGIIRFIAFYSGSNVFIQIQDDGRGIDPVNIRKKAVEKGLIAPDLQLSLKETYDLLFLPGFSTAQRITEVSGRGVGMDVVKQKISNLRGEIDVDSEVNLGTSVTLKLPLTLSIIDTLLVQINNSFFLIPLSVIEICNISTHAQLFSKREHRIEYQDGLIPFIYLRDYFRLGSTPPEQEHLVVIVNNDKRFALVVDKVLGEHQAVIKPLGQVFENQEFLAGASILGDGNLALIIDTNKLIKSLN